MTPPANSDQKAIKATLWGVLIAAMVAVVALKVMNPRGSNQHANSNAPVVDATTAGAGNPDEGDLPSYFPAGQFSLTDQDGKPFSSTDLRGRPWVASFIFTTCGNICPVMTANLAAIQPRLPAGVRLVSFSVDPDTDTPDKLKAYARDHKADESRWRFLTGTREQMFKAASDMKVAAQPATGNQPINHDPRVLLVDGAGTVRGIYDGLDAASLEQLVKDAPKFIPAHPAGASSPAPASRPSTQPRSAGGEGGTP